RGWTAPLTVGALAVGAVLAVAFVVWELHVDHPLLDPRLFRYRGFAVGSASLLVLFVALFGLFLVILQYLQLLLGYSALKSAPATKATLSSLPAAKQGVASAVNDTTREIGTALGIALMGSMFTTGYRHAIDGHLAGLPAGAAAQAREAPGLALAAAHHLGRGG